MTARVVLRAVGIMRRALRVTAVAQRMEEGSRGAGCIRTIRRCRRVVTIFRGVAGAFIGANVVAVVVLVWIVRQHGSRAEAHQTGGCEEDQRKARTGFFHTRSQTLRACGYSNLLNRQGHIQPSRFTVRKRSAWR